MPSLPERQPAQHRTAGLVLAAGASWRLGRPRQLLPYGRGLLLDAVLATARDCGFDRAVLALGGAAAEVQRTVDTTGCQIVLTPDFGAGCSSSIAAGIAALHPDTDAVVLLLGDQPVWRLLAQRAGDAVERPVPGRVPLDVDTEQDCRRILAGLEGAQ
jgi:molybdenum cofactor cytidylyltransferase